MSEELFHLEVITPQRAVFSGEVQEVVAPGSGGLFGVLKGHVNYITEVAPGPLDFHHQGEAHHYVVGGGFAQVGASKVVILTDLCVPVADLDVAEIRVRVAGAEAIMKDSDPFSREYLDAKAALALGQAQLWAVAGQQGSGDHK